MKRYQFRLDPVLKLRKLKEENCRMELGQLLMELNRIEDQLAHDKNEIDTYYKIQEGGLKTGMSGGQLQAFPMLIAAKNKNLELLERDKRRQEQKVADKKQELAQLRGDLKVMESMKEKDYEQYRKALNKEIDQKVEEQTQNWLNHKDK
ncbi:flagellar export protein FliJ [Peredibacter starrii]|uniref:Flagellar FliJ protein n=1 Tax=Peredibacter starrii TaxID=28202 RepID=A0AAX4HNT9_9BACT|nr:flagellar FliJ family protein [Peredibacter starrii]WPU64916.1 flagellar FliJ family protein [Peredibacter starrii]